MSRRGPLVVAFAVLAVSAAAAVAWFTVTGGSSSAATVGRLQTVTASALVGGDAPGSALRPGGSAEVIVRVGNPNAYSVTLTGVTANGTITADAAHPGCTPTGVGFTPQAALAIALAPGSSLVRLPGAASMSTSAPNACQGATFAIPVALTVKTP